MDVDLFREEVRRFIEQEFDPAAAEGQFPAADTPEKAAFIQKLAARRWIGVDWPVEYGGGGQEGVHKLVLQEELDYAALPSLTVELGVGQTILRFGSEPMKREFLPRITGGELSVALGLSEPDAGSDLAAVQLRAVAQGDGFVVNGQKMWTSAAHFADVIWLVCRTNVDAPKHEGISLLLVDARSSGIEVRPIHTMGDHRTNMVYFTDVRVPASRLVGEVDRGWQYLVETLDFERLGHPFGSLQRAFDEFLSWARGGDRWLDLETRRLAARLSVDVEMARSHMTRSYSLLSRHETPTIEATMLKVAMTETQQNMADAVIDLLGSPGLLHSSDEDAPMGGRFEIAWRAEIIRTIAGGANELMRNILARRHLRLPLTPREPGANPRGQAHGGPERVATNDFMTLLRTAMRASSAGDMEGFADTHTDDVVVYVNGNVWVRGRPELIDYWHRWFDAFPDLRMRPMAVLTDETRMFTDVEITGTHTGPFRALNGRTYEPTGRAFTAMGVTHFTMRDGRIAEVKEFNDFEGIMRQLELTEEPQTHGAPQEV